MDKLAQLETTDLKEIVWPTAGIFLPLLEQHRSRILSIPKKTFQYGPTSRHQLDIYYPPSLSADAPGKTPILFHLYGGGFDTGSRTLDPPADLLYANIGAYFAERGYITVIPDYRLIPHVTFPDPARDVRDAMEWVVSHPEELKHGAVVQPDIDTLFLQGFSAGSVHAFTVIALPELHSASVHPRIKGLILVSGPHRYKPETYGRDNVIAYWGSIEEAFKKDPLGLLQSQDSPNLPPLLLVEPERDPAWLRRAAQLFREALLTRPRLKFDTVVAPGHNHLSTMTAIGTGEGEAWAEQVIKFMNDHL